jgi:hypothetical protein
MRNSFPAVKSAQKLARSFLLWVARTFGTQLIDHRTGESIGRVLILPRKGKLAIFGLVKGIRAEFLPQTRLTYGLQELAFSVAPEPDYPNVRSTDSSSHAPRA